MPNFNLSDSQLLKLTGLVDILNEDEINSLTPIKDERTDYVRLEVSCSELDLLIIMIYPSNKLIYVDVILGSGKTKGISKLWLKSFVKYATSAKYKYIDLSAHRNDAHVLKYKGKEYKWNGYFVWGEIGFRMILPLEIRDFLQIVADSNRNDKELYQMLKDVEGRKIWSLKGFKWVGRFDLASKSTSRSILFDKINYK